MALERTIDPLTYTALQSTFHPVVMVVVDWPDGTIYVHNNTGDIEFNGNNYQGLGYIAGLSIPEESFGIVSAEASLSISGTIEDLLDATDVDSKNSDVTVYIGLTTEPNGNQLVGAPIEMFSGYLDENEFSDVSGDGKNRLHSLQYGVSSGPSARSKASIVHSYEDQISKFPLDEIMRHTIHARARSNNPALFPEP